MTHYLITFPQGAMDGLRDEELDAVLRRAAG